MYRKPEGVLPPNMEVSCTKVEVDASAKVQLMPEHPQHWEVISRTQS